MPRRKKSSPAEDFMNLVALLPWWVGIALAVLSFVVLHAIASRPTALITQPGQMSAVLTQTLWKTLASVGQYALPIICVAGAGMSAWKRKVRQDLVTSVVQNKAADVLDGMSWQEFEMLTAEAFRLQGYRVLETGGGGADGGVDLVLSRPGTNGSEKFLVQCKQWRAFKVGVDVVRELYGVMAAKGASGGFVITSGRFTQEASSFAQGRNVKLIDGEHLHALLQRARTGLARSQVPPIASPIPVPTPPAEVGVAESRATSCPSCSKPMIRRLAKRGTNAGTAFWGCTGYPVCRATRPVA